MNKNCEFTLNKSIVSVVSAIGVIFGFGGMSHGFFETLQGNTRTSGFIINAIGPTHQMWEHGNEPAFTIIPNFLVTGLLAMIIGLIIIVFSLKFLHTRYASSIFLFLFVMLFLVGGGIGQIIFFTYGWILATRIRKPLHFSRKILPIAFRRIVRYIWKFSLIISTLCIIFSLEIASFGFVPGINDPELLSNIMLISLGIGFFALILSSLGAIANDIQIRMEGTSK